MRTPVDVLVGIPCFKCLFWEPLRQSYLYCNPNECQKLTEWLLREVENPKQVEEDLEACVAIGHEASAKKK